VIVNDKLGAMWNEAVMAYFKVLPQIYLETLKETRKVSIRIPVAGIRIKIRTRNLPNTKQECR